MKNNIFENAYFGKPYKTRDGRKAIFLHRYPHGEICNELAIEDKEGRRRFVLYEDDGSFFHKERSEDIVSEWQEFIICKCQWKDYYDYRIVTSDAKGHIRLSFFADEICISDLYVNESCRCQGIGTKLLDKVDELLNGRKATIVPLEDWESEWYKRRGYIVKKDVEQEPINKKEGIDKNVLDMLTNNIMRSAPKSMIINNIGVPSFQVHEDAVYKSIRKAIKIGYRKAKEE